ncbi:MAG: multidrug transporter [Reichenbachiella sp.]
MQAGKRYTLWQTIRWTRKTIFLFILFDSIPVALFYFFGFEWLVIPWQPLSIIGIAVAFYLGFKNNSSYDRLWEARKIWGGIVNTSRSLTVMTRDFVTNEHAHQKKSEEELKSIHRTIVHRHIAWMYALTFQMRELRDWEHNTKDDQMLRASLGLQNPSEKFELLKDYLSEDEYNYIMSKGNKASHILSLQSKHFLKLKEEGHIEDFRHMELEKMVLELYNLQGKSERIKNFPFPRQYATANYFFVCIFLLLLPFGMLSVFTGRADTYSIWMAIPFSVLASWVFWIMESIGEYSENPFEGLYNDVPITSMARGIEIDIRQMLDEEDLPEPIGSLGDLKILY